jgi:hypothetical protein
MRWCFIVNEGVGDPGRGGRHKLGIAGRHGQFEYKRVSHSGGDVHRCAVSRGRALSLQQGGPAFWPSWQGSLF